MRVMLVRIAMALTLGLMASGARADVVHLDNSPDATGANNNGNWVNQAGSENFAETVEFANAVSVSEMDIYTFAGIPSVGMPVTLRLFSDSAGQPGTLLDELALTLSAVDTDGITSPAWDGHVRAHADLGSPLSLLTNTVYWIGLSGTSAEFGLDTLGGSGTSGRSPISTISPSISSPPSARWRSAWKGSPPCTSPPLLASAASVWRASSAARGGPRAPRTSLDRPAAASCGPSSVGGSGGKCRPCAAGREAAARNPARRRRLPCVSAVRRRGPGHGRAFQRLPLPVDPRLHGGAPDGAAPDPVLGAHLRRAVVGLPLLEGLDLHRDRLDHLEGRGGHRLVLAHHRDEPVGRLRLDDVSSHQPVDEAPAPAAPASPRVAGRCSGRGARADARRRRDAASRTFVRVRSPSFVQAAVAGRSGGPS
jgi:hypothetical protein